MIKVTLNIATQALVFEAKTLTLEGNRLTIELPDAQVKLKHEPVMYPVPEIEETTHIQAPVKPYKKEQSEKQPRTTARRGKPAATGTKICRICHETYKPTSNAQRMCPKCKEIQTDAKRKPFLQKEQEIKRNVHKVKNPIPDPNENLSTEELKKKYYGHFDDEKIDKAILDPMGLKQSY